MSTNVGHRSRSLSALFEFMIQLFCAVPIFGTAFVKNIHLFQNISDQQSLYFSHRKRVKVTATLIYRISLRHKFLQISIKKQERHL